MSGIVPPSGPRVLDRTEEIVARLSNIEQKVDSLDRKMDLILEILRNRPPPMPNPRPPGYPPRSWPPYVGGCPPPGCCGPC